MLNRQLVIIFVFLITPFIQDAQNSVDEIEFEYLEALDIDLEELYALTEDNDARIWIGTKSSGLFVYDGYHFEHFIQNRHDSINLPTNNITAVYKNKKGGIYVTHRRGLYEIGGTKKNIVQHQIADKNGKGHSYQWIHSLWDDREIRWLGTKNGLVAYTKKDSSSVHYPIFFENDKNPTQGYTINKIIKDPYKDQLWLGTSFGLQLFDLNTRTYTPIKNQVKWHQISPEYKYFSMIDLYLDKNHDLWLACLWSGGIMRYNIIQNKWETFLYQTDKLHPYKGNAITSIIYINDSTIYFTNDLGFGKIDFDSHKLVMLDSYDSNKGGWLRKSMIDRNGFLWMAGEKALIRSHNPVIFRKSKAQKPSLISIKKANQKIHYSSEMNLIFKSKDINSTLEIGVINPPYTELLKYKWKINSSNWTVPSNNRNIPISACKYGINNIQFSASMDEENWTNGKQIRVIIQKPYYFKTKFILITLSILLSILFLSSLFIKMYNKRILKQKRAHEMQLIELEMQSLRYQMNPHFIFNSLSSINNFILKEEIESASEYLTKFAKLMRAVLQNSKNKLVPLTSEIETLSLYLELEKLRFHDRFKYSILQNTITNPKDIYLPPSLIQPFIENSIWHGIMSKESEGHIILKIEEENEILIITIEDNGIGREMARRLKRSKKTTKKSMSMDITESRIASINNLYNTNASIKIIDLFDSSKAIGTRVIIRLKKMNKNESHTT